MQRLARFAVALGYCLTIGAATLVSPNTAYSQQLKEVTFGLPSGSLATALPRVAKEMGLFAKHGLDPKFNILDNAAVTAAALIAGSINVILAGPGELIAAQANGQKVVTIAVSYAGQAATLVIAKSEADKLKVSPKAPINERLKAMDGMIIAGSGATAIAPIVFNGAAKAAGATLRMTYMNQTAMPAALERGAIQGFVSSAPFWTLAATKGFGVVWIAGPPGELPAEYSPVSSSLVQTRRDFAEANPDVIKRITDTFADFAKAIDERPQEVKAALAKLFPELDAQTLDLFFTTESVAWKHKPLTAQDMAREIGFMKASGITLPNMDSLTPATMVFP